MQIDKLYTEEAWLPVIKEQEQKLAYEKFTREDALDLGLKIIDIAKNKFHGSGAIRIVDEETVIFSYMMPGSVRDADWWMDQKFTGARFLGMSSLRALVESRYDRTGYDFNAWDHNILGGCFPVFNKAGGRPLAYVVFSGMQHYEDHQIIADAMAEQLGVEIPRVVKGMDEAE
ncbi:MAG: heme-binding protein [Eubacteriales bacterium]|nr:heme-binding protein [Eubacteriales bacterium]